MIRALFEQSDGAFLKRNQWVSFGLIGFFLGASLEGLAKAKR